MQCKLQLIICTDDGGEDTVTDLVTLRKNCKRIEHLGLALAEARPLLDTSPQRLLERQVTAFLASHESCETWGAALKVKGPIPGRSTRCLAPSRYSVHGSGTAAVTTANRPRFVL
jgi:hypothetical protein